MDRKFLVGIGLTLMGGILWGLSGASSQFLQQQRGITPEWLLVVRLLISGVVTVMAAYWQGHGKIFEVFKNAKRCDWCSGVRFARHGLMPIRLLPLDLLCRCGHCHRVAVLSADYYCALYGHSVFEIAYLGRNHKHRVGHHRDGYDCVTG